MQELENWMFAESTASQVVSKESSQISGYPRYGIPANHMVGSTSHHPIF
jgi:hypothetical protein